MFLLFLLTAFRRGWTHSETDFPGYYTAAVLERQHAPLRNYYNWPWFQREMNYAGIETQLGAYAAQTPLTMLPMVPLASFPVQTAKRIWMIVNLLLLAATIWMLSRATASRFEEVAVLAFCGYGSLDRNFVLGQYYVCLLFLLTLSFFFLDRARRVWSGASAGLAFGLKLYGGPFLVYFAVKRNWRALAGMVAAMCLMGVVAIGIFGWSDVHYYLTRILPRSLEGSPIDPYNPGNQTPSTILRRLLMFEPELNPHPFSYQPQLFFFLRPFLSLTILALTLLGLYSSREGNEHRDFAWFVIMILLLSTVIASYTYIVLLLPIALLLVDARPYERVALIVAYVLLADGVPLLSYFPKVWVLLGLFLFVGWPYWRGLRMKTLAPVFAAVAIFAAFDAHRHILSLAQEPISRFEPVAAERGGIFSDEPVVSNAGLFFDSIGHDRYELRWMHDGRIEELFFQGEALHPRTTTADGPISFELVAQGESRAMQFDPSTHTLRYATELPPRADDREPSPDGRWIAYTSNTTGTKQVWLRNLATGNARPITGGNCNNSSPAWELDSQSLIFASDCQRAVGVPGLYRVRLASITLP
jgi:Glycosyltransferase family 87/WD40-like Beta Propeller Repeat